MLTQIAKKIKKINLKPELEKNLIILLKNGQYDDLSNIVDDLFHRIADLAMDLSGFSDEDLYDDLVDGTYC